jgi:tetratricopeptide (TPR) repeat protein
MFKQRLLAVLVSSLLLGACTAHEKSGDKAAAVGDWKSAYVSYRAALADEPTPELKQKFEEARTHAMAETQKRAQACAQVNDWPCALQEADFALQMDGGNAELATFRANAAAQVALSRLEVADGASQRGQFPEAVAEVQRAEGLSSAPEVRARAQVVRAALVQRGQQRVEGLRQEGNLQAASSLASLVAAQDGSLAGWAQGVEREYVQYTLAESERLTQEGDAARRAHDWRGAEERYGAALQLRGDGRAREALEYVRRVAHAEARLDQRDWEGAAQGYRHALGTGQDDGYARSQLERVEPRPYRVALRSLLVTPTRPNGEAWVGPTTPHFSRLAQQLKRSAERSGASPLVLNLALSVPPENRPSVRVEVLLPDGMQLTTPEKRGVATGFDSEFVAVTNAFDERRLSFRVVVQTQDGEQSLGTVELPLNELAGRAEVTVQGRSVLALRLGSTPAEGRAPGSYADMSPVQQGRPPAPGHAASPVP